MRLKNYEFRSIFWNRSNQFLRDFMTENVMAFQFFNWPEKSPQELATLPPLHFWLTADCLPLTPLHKKENRSVRAGAVSPRGGCRKCF
jgi:hypothetical protein